MLVAIIMHLGIGIVAIMLMPRNVLADIVKDEPLATKTVCYVAWAVTAPILCIIGFCLGVIKAIRESKKES